MHDRTVRYLISMGIRTACMLAIIWVPGPWKLVCLVGAAVLPLFAVLLANAGRERTEVPPTLTALPTVGPDHQLPPGPAALPYDPDTEYLR